MNTPYLKFPTIFSHLGNSSSKNLDDADHVFPKIISTRSGIIARKDAVETAYTQIEPSKFYINLSYAVWGYKKLAER